MSNLAQTQKALSDAERDIERRIYDYFSRPDVVEEFRVAAWMKLGKTLTPEHQGWPKGGQQWFADYRAKYIEQWVSERTGARRKHGETPSVKKFREAL